MYIAPFVLDGVHYNCSEQFIVCVKARFFSDRQAESIIIISLQNPFEMKNVGKMLTWGSNHAQNAWHTFLLEHDVIFPGLCEKYKQNSHCAKILLAPDSK